MPRYAPQTLICLALLSIASAQQNGPQDKAVASVHVVFSHHLDVGLDLPLKDTSDCVGFATKIVQRYFDEHIPRAIRISQEMASAGHTTDRLRYQVHAWMASLYVDCVPWRVRDGCPLNPGSLRCPDAASVEAFDAAVRRGDIVYSASPFNIDPEAVGEPSLMEALPQVAADLDARYNLKPRARVWSNVDVKGFARSAVPLLRKAGVDALYVGQNGHPSYAPTVPTRGLQPVVGRSNASVFNWCDPVSERCMPVLYHLGYGGYETSDTCVVAPGGVALCSYFRTDNAGPPLTTAEVSLVFDTVRANFPNASVVASSFDEFAAEMLAASPSKRDPATGDVHLTGVPTTTLDWGDQWITGLSTDSSRLKTFREMARARADCINSGACDPSSAEMRNFTRLLAKNAEHTQGVQGEKWSPGIAGPFQEALADTQHWSNEEFAKVHNADFNKFWQGDLSWLESRKFSQLALEAAPPTLASDIRARLEALRPSQPQTGGLKQVPISKVANATFECLGGPRLRFDPESGAVVGLSVDRAIDGTMVTGRLFDLTYTTYNTMELWDTRKNLSCEYSGCANPEDRVWYPTLDAVFTNASVDSHERRGDAGTGRCTVVTRVQFKPSLHSKYGAPLTAFVQYSLISGDADAPSRVDATLTLVNKSTTRLPESLMLGFRLADGDGEAYKNTDATQWELDVLGEWVRVGDVGNGTTDALQRAVWRGARVSLPPSGASKRGSSDNQTHLVFETLDAGLMCPIIPGLGLLGDATPMGEGVTPPAPLEGVVGVAVSLQQNLMPISGFAQWFPFGVGKDYQKQDEMASFRFSVVREVSE